MQPDWNIQIERPKFAASRLASLQVESPSNSQTTDEIGILLSLWCGREAIQVDVEKTLYNFNVGFTVGELELSVKNGRISSQNRFTQEFYREKIDQKAKDTSSKEGKAGVFLGLELPKFFSGTKFGIEGGAKIARGSIVLEEKKETIIGYTGELPTLDTIVGDASDTALMNITYLKTKYWATIFYAS